MKILEKILITLIMSFIGGFMAIIFLSYYGRTKDLIPGVDQAVSIANTYIVFTTFIFVAFTVLITVVCYVLAQGYSSHTKALHNETVDNIRDCIGSDDEKAEKILNSMLSSPLIQKHLSNRLNVLIERELTARISERKQIGESQFADVEDMRSWLVNGDENSHRNVGRGTSFQGPMSQNDVDEFRGSGRSKLNRVPGVNRNSDRG